MPKGNIYIKQKVCKTDTVTEEKELREEIKDLREDIDSLSSGIKSMQQNILALTNLLAELLDSLDAEALLDTPPLAETLKKSKESGPPMHG